MTEDIWLVCAEPVWLRNHLGVAQHSRKNLLLLSACFRLIWEWLPDACRNWVLVAERIADSAGNRDQLNNGAVHNWFWDEHYAGDGETRDLIIDSLWGLFGVYKGRPEQGGTDDEDFIQELARQAALVRDIFGNPFRPVTFDPAWRSATVVSLSQAIYDERVFDRMPILADALEDAGCNNADVLNHCRQPGEHVRGCWVVDLVLGKE